MVTYYLALFILFFHYSTQFSKTIEKRRTTKTGVIWWDGGIGRSWTCLLPWTQVIYSYIQNILSEKDLKTGWTVSTTKGKRTEMRWVGESEIWPHKGKNDILATAVGPQLGTTSKIWLISLRSKGFELYIRQPKSQILYKREESLQYLTLKVSGKQTQENYRTTGNQKLTLKGLIYKLIWPEKQHRNIILKVHEP